MTEFRVRALAPVALAGLFALGCGGADTSGPGGPTIRGLRMVNGAGVGDTAGAVLVQALVVEVHDSTGALAPVGTTVRFTGVPRSQSSSTETLVAALASSSFSTFATGATDETGRTGVIVKLGTVAGPARLAISVPIFGLLDTARYTVAPGAAARVTLAPSDTLIYVGAGYNLRGGVVDQFGNARADAITWTTSGGGVTVSSSGALSATSLGRYTITATSGTGTGTAAVSVAPHGRLAGLVASGTLSIALADPDGSHVRLLTATSDGGVGVHPVWMPGGGSVIFAGLVAGIETLQIVDTNGVVRRFLTGSLPDVSHHADATPTSDGQWVYFGAYDDRCAVAYCLYRARSDGSGAELLGTSATSGSNLRPSPSPDGSRVAYVGGGFGAGVIRVFDVASRTVEAWQVNGDFPAWSPDGTLIAFVPPFGGALSVIKPDGSGVRSLNTRSYWASQIGWTADSHYVIARNSSSGAIELVDATSGAALPLSWSSSFVSGSLK